MRDKRFQFITSLLLLIGFITLACSQRTVLHAFIPRSTETPIFIPSSTATATRTQQPTRTLTPTPLPTSTYTPFPIPTDQPIEGTNLFLDILTPIENAGFAIRPVIGYELDDQVDNGIAMISPDGLIFIGFEAFVFDPIYDSIEEMNDAFLEGFTSELEFTFESSDPYPLTIDGQQALAYDLSSDTYHLEGQSFALDTDNGLFVYGFGFGLSPTYSSTWDKEGQAVFTALLDTLKFIPVTSGNCSISTDPSYGYTPENPIKISGSSTYKYNREKQYMAYLRQPYGESVTYLRLGAVEVQDTKLDEFEVALGDQTVRLYFDFNSSGDLLAPVGFDCWGEITVQDYAW